MSGIERIRADDDHPLTRKAMDLPAAYLPHTAGMYVQMLEHVEEGSGPRAHAKAVDIAEETVVRIAEESGNAVEQLAILAMTAWTLLLTTMATEDTLGVKLEIIDMEDGGAE